MCLFIVSPRSAVNNLHLWTWQDYFGHGFSRSEWGACCVCVCVCVCAQAHMYEFGTGVSQISLSHKMIAGKGKSKGTGVKVGQEVIHHMTCVRLLTNISLFLSFLPSFLMNTHTHTHTHTHIYTHKAVLWLSQAWKLASLTPGLNRVWGGEERGKVKEGRDR